jgi:lysophospholipase L1-like esterase
LQELCRRIREIVREHADQNVSLIELNAVLKGHPDWLTPEDGVHPNRLGYHAVAQAVAKAIRPARKSRSHLDPVQKRDP